jgi:sec-independent protein translocase protein TatC
MGIHLVPSDALEIGARLEGMGRLIDATHQGLPGAKSNLLQAMDKRAEAIAAYGKEDFSGAGKLLDRAQLLIASGSSEHAIPFEQLWRLEKALGSGKASLQSLNWTKPMLSMREQLTLVLVLELAFGVIFELPLIMAVLGMAGLISSKFLMKYQRHAFVVCLILAAIITPTGDAINLALMAGPMLMCFELGVLAVWLMEKRRGRTTSITPVT